MSLKNPILYPPTIDFDYLVQRPQQLMKAFAEEQVLSYYVNPPKHDTPRGIREVAPKLYLLNHVDPNEVLRENRPVVYFSAAAQIDLVKQYKPALVVFDSLDEPSDEFEAWKNHYERAVHLADVVIATSDKLYEMAIQRNPNSYLIPNASDYESFSPAAYNTFPIPEDLVNIPKPIIIYVGAVASWCDLDLISEVAQNFPDFSIVLVGPLYNIKEAPSAPNIHWLDYKAYHQLPSYLQHADIAIIPFKLTSMTESVNPIKMWEYLAAGLPVVSTALPEIKKYSDVVLYSENNNHFMENIKLALYHDNEEKKQKRMELARINSWNSRAQEIISIVGRVLEGKGQVQEQVEEQVQVQGKVTVQEQVTVQDQVQVQGKVTVQDQGKVQDQDYVKPIIAELTWRTSYFKIRYYRRGVFLRLSTTRAKIKQDLKTNIVSSSGPRIRYTSGAFHYNTGRR